MHIEPSRETKSKCQRVQVRMKCRLEIGDLEVVLDLAGVKSLALRINAWGGEHVGSLVHVGEQEGGANTGFGVKPGAAVAMPASSDLEVERTVNSVFLCSENRRQVFCHYCSSMAKTVVMMVVINSLPPRFGSSYL